MVNTGQCCIVLNGRINMGFNEDGIVVIENGNSIATREAWNGYTYIVFSLVQLLGIAFNYYLHRTPDGER